MNIDEILQELSQSLSIKWDINGEKFKRRYPKDILDMFNVIDYNHNSSINCKEFTKRLALFSGLSPEKCSCIFEHFDKDKKNDISYDEFLQTIHQILKPSRHYGILHFFSRLDTDGSKVITCKDVNTTPFKKINIDIIMGFYNIKNKEVIPYNDFCRYYIDNSMYMIDDKEFYDFMCGMWRISGKEYYNTPPSVLKENLATPNNVVEIETPRKELGLKNLLIVRDTLVKSVLEHNAKSSWSRITYHDIAKKLFSRGDKSKDEYLSKLEFYECFSKQPYKFTQSDCDAMFAVMDLSSSDTITLPEFLYSTHCKIGVSRYNIIKSLYKLLKKDSYNTELSIYMFKMSDHPDVLSGKTIDVACFVKFISQIPPLYGISSNSKSISFHVFLHHHIDISLSIVDDEEFNKHIHKIWRM